MRKLFITLDHFWFNFKVWWLNTFDGKKYWYLSDYKKAHVREFSHPAIGESHEIHYYMRSSDLDLWYIYDLEKERPLTEKEQEKFMRRCKIDEDWLFTAVFAHWNDYKFYYED